ncbi:hypothetical protein Cob_v006130 [Colletotrichum orbiculare MAFF 240422]|uniref:Uncharacterized protein n=1 Tax=Colletotrichum orbiculare (strain 104-T / ATCC 96160 / CBS 514.97 / LARS 414 / MAFF 240422) TaxID=1213857 RepID=A0A484FSM1_COLOR|nr:hypothetical protein Cob_v006130 [Colletotrichum orbiculare MAFF 240422]
MAPKLGNSGGPIPGTIADATQDRHERIRLIKRQHMDDAERGRQQSIRFTTPSFPAILHKSGLALRSIQQIAQSVLFALYSIGQAFKQGFAQQRLLASLEHNKNVPFVLYRSSAVLLNRRVLRSLGAKHC